MNNLGFDRKKIQMTLFDDESYKQFQSSVEHDPLLQTMWKVLEFRNCSRIKKKMQKIILNKMLDIFCNKQPSINKKNGTLPIMGGGG